MNILPAKLAALISYSASHIKTTLTKSPYKELPYDVYEITQSDVVIDCNGDYFNEGKLTEIRIHTRVENITIQNCKLKGSIRIYGLGLNGESEEVRKSSLNINHTQNAQSFAPRNIQISNVTFESVQRIPLYISPGVTYVNVENCRFNGTCASTVVYLDAESGYNTIKNCKFNVNQNRKVREVIAIDGSANNQILNNTFENVTGGGIYLYRNCGDGGTIRHQPPQNNLIQNNTFDLKKLNWFSYGIWIGSRSGMRPYCYSDEKYNFGSSKNSGDFAEYNTLINNVFIGSNRKIRDDGKNNKIK